MDPIMPKLAFVACSGLRVRSEPMARLGMTSPELRRRGAALNAMPSLGLLTLAGMTPEHWHKSWHELGSENKQECLDTIVSSQPDLVALSTLSASVEEAYSLAEALESQGIRTVMGGLHASACPDEVQKYCSAAVVGDGENYWLELLQDAEFGRLKGLYSGRPPFPLALSPLPDYSLLPNSSKRPRFTLQTQRGCPFACEFCGASRLLGPFREKPLTQIEAEIAQIVSLDPRPVIELADDNSFAGSRKHRDLLALFENSPIRYFTEVDWRAGEQPEIVEALARSGCVQVLIGFESQVFAHPGMGAKGCDFQRMKNAALALQNAGILVNACFIVGADGETEDSLRQLGDLLTSPTSPFAQIQLTLQTPFAGTALRRRLKDEGRLLKDRGWSHCTLFDLCYEPDKMSVKALESGFLELVTRVFHSSQNRRRQAIRKDIMRRWMSLRPKRPQSR